MEELKFSNLIKTFINKSITRDLVKYLRPGSSKLYSIYYNHWFNIKFNRDRNGIYNTDISNILNPQLISSILNNSEDIICISLFIDNVFTGSNAGHQNVIIIRKSVNTFEHYEPNGSPQSNVFIRINNKIKLLYDKLLEYLPDLIFIDSHELHPYNENIGFQSLINDSYDEQGYCQFWCYLVIYLVMRFKTLETKRILKSIEDFSVNNKNPVRRLKEIIRGFTYMSLEKILELVNLPIIDDLFDGTKSRDLLLSILETNLLDYI
jgi:hypothetical protein